MNEGGLLNRFERVIAKTEMVEGKEGAITLGFENTAFPCSVFLIGVSLGFLQLVAECLWKFVKDKGAYSKSQRQLALHAHTQDRARARQLHALHL